MSSESAEPERFPDSSPFSVTDTGDAVSDRDAEDGGFEEDIVRVGTSEKNTVEAFFETTAESTGRAAEESAGRTTAETAARAAAEAVRKAAAGNTARTAAGAAFNAENPAPPTDTWQNPFESDATAVWQPAEDRITHYADRYRNMEKKTGKKRKFQGKSSKSVQKASENTEKNASVSGESFAPSDTAALAAEHVNQKNTKAKKPEKINGFLKQTGTLLRSLPAGIAAGKVGKYGKSGTDGKAKKERQEKKFEKAGKKAFGKLQKKEQSEREPLLASVSPAAISVTGGVLTAFCLLFVLLAVNPAAGSASTTVKKEEKAAELTTSLTALTNSTAAEILAAAATPEPTPVPVPEKVRYSIPETELVAPAPEAACYGSVMPDSAAEINTVIQRARESGLLGETETTVFRSDASFRSDTAIRYYLDETLLVICWKELIDGNTCSCAEIRIADASQFRRKFADDAFGSSNSYYATDLAKSVNAVAAMNADYYLFRDFGIVVYNRELYRFNENTYSGTYKKYNCVDTCFITETGDIRYFRKGQETTEEELRQYIADEGIVFSIAFGPVLVENGEALYTDSYPVGEIDKGYSRAGFGQVDTLHYFYMNLNHSDEKQARWNINTFAEHFAEKGVQTGYAFDGGQTGELVFQGEPYNYIDFGAERLVSDIIYFATAYPGEGAVS